MFIFSLKISKRKIIICFSIIIVIVALFITYLFFRPNCNQATCSIGKYNLLVKNNTDRINFLKQFGWEVAEEPTEISNITIPSDFNSTYDEYNNIQHKQGLDLSKYKEKNCTRYTYQILNYKDKSQSVRANLIVFNDKIIGGDVSSVNLKGFVHGFCYPDKN